MPRRIAIVCMLALSARPCSPRRLRPRRPSAGRARPPRDHVGLSDAPRGRREADDQGPPLQVEAPQEHRRLPRAERPVGAKPFPCEQDGSCSECRRRSRLLSRDEGNRAPPLQARGARRQVQRLPPRRLSPVVVAAGDGGGGGGGGGGTPAGCDSSSDHDGDLLANDFELQIETDPCLGDTDLDGVEDGYEYQSALDLNHYRGPRASVSRQAPVRTRSTLDRRGDRLRRRHLTLREVSGVGRVLGGRCAAREAPDHPGRPALQRRVAEVDRPGAGGAGGSARRLDARLHR